MCLLEKVVLTTQRQHDIRVPVRATQPCVQQRSSKRMLVFIDLEMELVVYDFEQCIDTHVYTVHTHLNSHVDRFTHACRDVISATCVVE